VPTEAAIKARKHFDHRFPLAEGFLTGAGECLSKQQYNVCTFLLHQTVEQICIALVRVHIAYRSEFHNLYRLLRLSCCFSDQPYQLFLDNADDQKLFDVLAKSYSSARYNDGFLVSEENANRLYERVVAFVEMARMMCIDKINELENEE
jgi:HEPN domain-containing protein